MFPETIGYWKHFVGAYSDFLMLRVVYNFPLLLLSPDIIKHCSSPDETGVHLQLLGIGVLYLKK